MKIKQLLVLLIAFLLLGCNKTTQKTDAKKDSLAVYLNIAHDIKVGNGNRLKANDKALEIVLNQKNDSLNRINFLKIANQYRNILQFDKFKSTTFYALKLSEDTNDSIRIAKAYSYLRDYYAQMYNSDSANFYYTKTEKLYKLLKNNLKLAEILIDKSSGQIKEKEYAGAEISVYKALKFINANDQELLYQCFNLLGIIYGELNEFEKSTEYHKKALDIFKNDRSNDSAPYVLMTLNNLGLVYQNKKEYKKSIFYLQKALKYTKILKYEYFTEAALKTNLGYSKLKLNDLKDLPKLFYEPLKIFEKSNAIPSIINTKLNLTEYYTYIKDTTNANKFANSAYQLAKSNKLPSDILLSLKQLIIVNPKKAATYSTEYIKINDSLQIAERKNRSRFSRIEYETSELTSKNKTLLTQNKIAIGIGIAVALLLSLLLFIRYTKSKNKEKRFKKAQQVADNEIYKLMLEQNKKIEEGKQIEKKRISRELHDGVMGKLTAIRLNLFVLSKRKDDATIEKCLNHIAEIQTLEKEIKNIAYELENNIFSDNINFETTIKNLFSAIENHSDMDFKIDIDNKINWDNVDTIIKTQLYRILQEALHNIEKHSQATVVILNIYQENTTLKIEMADNGVGFEIKNNKTGFGLKNMKSRMDEIKGNIAISAQLNAGTKINLIIPI
ncbi:MAG: tetratricopeptide repeat protein [Flavobacterium sp.]|nr:tetratricopeptide repeat protein [Flavobacterium sp.]